MKTAPAILKAMKKYRQKAEVKEKERSYLYAWREKNREKNNATRRIWYARQLKSV